MSDREFRFVKVQRDGAARSAYRITCCKCGGTEDMVQTGAKRMPPVAAEQRFRNHGWSVGSSVSQDVCPSCAAKPRAVKSLADLKLIVNEPKEAPVHVAETPAEPTREERRIIFAKLQDVYLDEVQGYDAGWTDHRVAGDLGVPRAWVASIRDENFGPAKDNPEIREFLAKLDQVTVECGEVRKKAELAIAAAEALSIRMKELERLAKSVRAQVAA